MASRRRAWFRTGQGLAATAAILALAGTARAQAQPWLGDSLSCASAGQLAERRWGLPPGLLGAIGKVESGRYDPALGGVAAWPWTINAAGRGEQFADRDTAIRTVGHLQAQGVRSIDIGCFQINLIHHPHAFTSLEEGFDPQTNADYAARFLAELQARTGSWQSAIGAYHSGSPGLARDYRARVYAAWAGRPAPESAQPSGPVMIPVIFPPVRPAPMPPMPTVARLQARLPATAGAVVWNVAAQANGVRVWTAAPAHAAPPRRPARGRRTALAAR